MHPIERLRLLARCGDLDVDVLVPEATAALADLAADPRAAVMAARNLVDAHPCCGPLWWAAAHVICAEDPHEAARLVIASLDSDPTVEELAASLPAGATVVAEATPLVVGALATRPDLDARLVGDRSRLASLLRELARGPEATGWSFDEAVAALVGARVLVVEASAAGPVGFLGAGASLAARAREAGVAVWAVAGVGRVLPAALFTVAAGRCRQDRFVAVGHLARVVGPSGAVRPVTAFASAECPVPLELTR